MAQEEREQSLVRLRRPGKERSEESNLLKRMKSAGFSMWTIRRCRESACYSEKKIGLRQPQVLTEARMKVALKIRRVQAEKSKTKVDP